MGEERKPAPDIPEMDDRGRIPCHGVRFVSDETAEKLAPAQHVPLVGGKGMHHRTAVRVPKASACAETEKGCLSAAGLQRPQVGPDMGLRALAARIGVKSPIKYFHETNAITEPATLQPCFNHSVIFVREAPGKCLSGPGRSFHGTSRTASMQEESSRESAQIQQGSEQCK